MFFGVFRTIDIIWPMLASIALALAINPRIMLKIDYALLLTFTGFFIFISDIQQIPVIVNLIHGTENTKEEENKDSSSYQRRAPADLDWLSFLHRNFFFRNKQKD